ncbi:MAG: hypothetical protein JRJ59_13360, partial [Deltaproteobacteria bacterium]|nr:hypothetical protein [Deltaproteobacteria bacterium]
GGLGQTARKTCFRPWTFRARQLAKRLGVPVNDHFRSLFGLVPPLKEVTPAAYGRLVKRLKPGVTELMVHPADSRDVKNLWDFQDQLMDDRLAEAALLIDPRFKADLAASGARLIHYGQL